MSIDLTNPMFTNEDAARAYFEGVRWPNGPVCPHCGVINEATLVKGQSHRPGLYQCNACREPFTVTIGSVMESSHVPLHKWALAFRLMASSKKGVSASSTDFNSTGSVSIFEKSAINSLTCMGGAPNKKAREIPGFQFVLA